jgi:hypothetical protein
MMNIRGEWTAVGGLGPFDSVMKLCDLRDGTVFKYGGITYTKGTHISHPRQCDDGYSDTLYGKPCFRCYPKIGGVFQWGKLSKLIPVETEVFADYD